MSSFSKWNIINASLTLLAHCINSQSSSLIWLQITTFGWNGFSSWRFKCQWQYKVCLTNRILSDRLKIQGSEIQGKGGRWYMREIICNWGCILERRALKYMKDRHGIWPKVKLNVKSTSKCLQSDCCVPSSSLLVLCWQSHSLVLTLIRDAILALLLLLLSLEAAYNLVILPISHRETFSAHWRKMTDIQWAVDQTFSPECITPRLIHHLNVLNDNLF